jgi:hypothetical protein
MKKTLFTVFFFVLALGATGCAHKITSTPAYMTYDGSNVDYSKIDTMKRATVCKGLHSSDGNTSIIAAAKAGEISKIKHVDISFEFKQFLFWPTSQFNCVTVYGE